MWPFDRWFRKEPPKQLPPPEPSPLEAWARQIAQDEFPGQAGLVTVHYGLWNVSCVVLSQQQDWLAEVVTDKHDGQMYRIRREPKTP